MIRTACAWVLLILAASPVTAPFSTCDLRSLAPHEAIALASAFQHSGSLTVATPVGTDADSVSPLVTRSLLPDDSASSVTVAPQTQKDDATPGAHRLYDLNRPLRELPAQQTVLRV